MCLLKANVLCTIEYSFFFYFFGNNKNNATNIKTIINGFIPPNDPNIELDPATVFAVSPITGVIETIFETGSFPAFVKA